MAQTQDEQKAASGHYRENVQADGGRGVLVVGQEMWEEWAGQAVEETSWRRQVKRKSREMEQATVRRERNKDLE